MHTRKLSIRLTSVLAVLTGSLLVLGVSAHAQTTIFSFEGPNGSAPRGSLVFDSVGHLFGTASEGGSTNHGVVFELIPAGGGSWTEEVRHNFGVGSDGSTPYSNLIFDAAGNLYGTTTKGGTYNGGIVFELSPQDNPQWIETVLYNFGNGTDGATPDAGLIFDASGNLYGTTAAGGASGAGTVFELIPNGVGGWTEKILYSFVGGTDGSAPYAGLIFDSSGNLYGTTTSGGSYGGGTAFQLYRFGPGWRKKILHNFGGFFDGKNPYGGLVFDASGNLFGTTVSGGTANNDEHFGAGTAFELSPNGPVAWVETAIYQFCNNPNVCGNDAPYDTPLMDASGNLYGTTEGGFKPFGGVFELSPTATPPWTETQLGNFSYDPPSGNRTYAGLIFDSAGNLYGASSAGGTDNFGAVFEVTH